MEKRYQVFISSTFKDLQDERQAALKAVLELNHMPAGMELFPATDETAWQLIKDVIDASDYYSLIIAGRYGSVDETGIGYTEKEYDYAVSTNKPVIPLLYKSPNILPREKTETDASVWNKLNNFRTKVEKKHTCVYWSSAEELKAKIIVGLTTIIKRHPQVGWVRADLVPKDTTISEVLKLKTRVLELEKEASQVNTKPLNGSEDLLQDEDAIEISFKFDSRKKTPDSNDYQDTLYNGKISLTWNQIFAAVAPRIINEASDTEFRKSINDYFTSMAKKEFVQEDDLKETSLRNFRFLKSDIDTCIIQLRAIGLIKESSKQRSVKDTLTYWTLTPYGDIKMVQLRALRKTPINENAIKRTSEKISS